MKKGLMSLTLLIAVSTVFGSDRSLPPDTAIVSSHSITVKGDRFNYKATTGTQPVWDENGKPIAYCHFTYYERSNVKNRSSRPLMISFNGGPGSGSVWMHLAYTGPIILKIDDEGYPIQPYGVRQNPYSILDVADIVYVNPVNTGYSRIMDEEVKREKFFGVNSDI